MNVLEPELRLLAVTWFKISREAGSTIQTNDIHTDLSRLEKQDADNKSSPAERMCQNLILCWYERASPWDDRSWRI